MNKKESWCSGIPDPVSSFFLMHSGERDDFRSPGLPVEELRCPGRVPCGGSVTGKMAMPIISPARPGRGDRAIHERCGEISI